MSIFRRNMMLPVAEEKKEGIILPAYDESTYPYKGIIYGTPSSESDLWGDTTQYGYLLMVASGLSSGVTKYADIRVKFKTATNYIVWYSTDGQNWTLKDSGSTTHYRTLLSASNLANSRFVNYSSILYGDWNSFDGEKTATNQTPSCGTFFYTLSALKTDLVHIKIKCRMVVTEFSASASVPINAYGYNLGLRTDTLVTINGVGTYEFEIDEYVTPVYAFSFTSSIGINSQTKVDGSMTYTSYYKDVEMEII